MGNYFARNSYNLGHPEYVIRTCLRYLKRHLLIITDHEALQTKKLNEKNCPYSNDVNLFVDIIFTIPVHIEIRMTEKSLHFLNSPCEIRQIKAQIMLV